MNQHLNKQVPESMSQRACHREQVPESMSQRACQNWPLFNSQKVEIKDFESKDFSQVSLSQMVLVSNKLPDPGSHG